MLQKKRVIIFNQETIFLRQKDKNHLHRGNGHIHQSHEADWDGIPVYSTPSTCFQFKPKSVDFALDDLPPAYRWIDLYSDGKIDTGVKYLHAFSANK